jgi:hypothetical protein
MEEQSYTITTVYRTYWVTDNDGHRYMYHDRLAAQMAEERYERERKECENSSTT